MCAKYCDEYVCLWVCLSVREDISGITRAIFTKFVMLPMSVARAYSDTFTIGRIAYRRDGVFFHTENVLSTGVHSAGKVCYLPTSFTNLSHHRLPSSLRTDSTDFTTGPLLLSISVFLVLVSSLFSFVRFRAAD